MMATTRTRLGPAGSRWACVMPITVVFLAGVIAGGALSIGAHRWIDRTIPFWTEGGKEISLQRWKTELNLTPEQTQQMKDILDDFGTYYRNVLSNGKARILAILNDEQKRKFEKLVSMR